jgi:hypothetical protein
MATDTPAEELLYFNGINGATGGYGLAPMTDKEFAAAITKQAKEFQGSENFRPMYGIDAKNLAESGWGIIFPTDDDDPARQQKNDRIKEALGDLIKLRQSQAGDLFKIFEGPQNVGGGFRFRKKDDKLGFLKRQKVGSGAVDPKKGVPYYLLLIGSPEEIPYRFQNELDVQYAVGRIDFGDDYEAYARYASSVVTAETGGLKLPRKVNFFGVESVDDKATAMSSQYLVQPLFEKLKAAKPDWTVEALLKDQAVKVQLQRVLGGDNMPALLFTASHGMEFPNGDSRQIPHQGALLCSDWKGPKAHKGSISQDLYFAGDDLSSDANLLGLIAFCFACYGAGTPLWDEFSKQAFKDKEQIAPRPFIASLPTRMLSQPKGGALAVIGHVERAWGYSFAYPGVGAHLVTFEETFNKLLDGYPVGSAVEVFNERYAELATEVTTKVGEYEDNPDEVDAREFAGLWTAHNDARGYVVIGDPAVRLHVAEVGGAVAEERPVITISAGKQQKLAVAANMRPASQSPAPTTTSASKPLAAEEPPAFDMTPFSVQVQEERTSLTDSIKKFTSELADSLKRAADDISSLEVITYSADDLNKVTYNYDDKKLHGELKMRALTRIAFDGDVQVCVPEKDGHIDQAVWDVHLSMVQAAQENRAAFLATMAELATKLIGMLGGK